MADKEQKEVEEMQAVLSRRAGDGKVDDQELPRLPWPRSLLKAGVKTADTGGIFRHAKIAFRFCRMACCKLRRQKACSYRRCFFAAQQYYLLNANGPEEEHVKLPISLTGL